MNKDTAPVDGLPAPQRRWAYATLLTGVTLAVLDSTVANVALPTIAQGFHVTQAASIDIVSVYQIVILVLLLPLASLGEIYGYRRVYAAGLAVFTLASLACALSGTLAMLTAARILQGFGAAGIMCVNTALIRYIFPHARLGRALGYNALTVAIASTAGPSIASIVLGFAPWNWLFAINVPIGIAAFIMGARSLPHSQRRAQRFDLPGAALTALGLGLVVTAVDRLGPGAPAAALGQGAAGAVLLALTGWLQRRRKAPLLPVDLLRLPAFSLAVATSACAFIAQMIGFVALPFYLQIQLGFPVTALGFLILPWPLALALAAPHTGRLADRLPVSLMGLAGMALLAAGLVLLASLPAHPNPFGIAWRMAVCGIGFGVFQPPNNRALLTAAPLARSGAASGMLSTARLFGQAIGAALVGFMLFHDGTRGAELSLWLGAGFAALAGAASLTRAAI